MKRPLSLALSPALAALLFSGCGTADNLDAAAENAAARNPACEPIRASGPS